MASAAYTAAGTQSDYYTTWFISTAYVSTVQKIYNDVANVRTTSPKISCTDTYSDCTDGSALLYTVPSANVVCSLLPSLGLYYFLPCNVRRKEFYAKTITNRETSI